MEALHLRDVRGRQLLLIGRSRITCAGGLAVLGGGLGLVVPAVGWLLGPAIAAAVLVGLAQQTLP